MTPEDEKDLRDLQAELLSTESSPWQPRCVARAFRSTPEPFVFTMQAWIDLDAVKSPFLLGQLPEPETAITEFELAFRAFGHEHTTPGECDGDELVLLGWKMVRAIQEGFAMRVRLAPLKGAELETPPDNGLGDWLPILACLKSQLHFSLAEAKALPVGQAFALLAAHRSNEGRVISGETYKLRDVPDEEEENSDG